MANGTKRRPNAEAAAEKETGTEGEMEEEEMEENEAKPSGT